MGKALTNKKDAYIKKKKKKKNKEKKKHSPHIHKTMNDIYTPRFTNDCGYYQEGGIS